MRYLPHTPEDRAAMCAFMGVASPEELFADVPEYARLNGPVPGLPLHQPEMEVQRHLTRRAAQNLAADRAACFLGAGAYRHHVPASVDHLIQRGEFLTSYTPYQPEVSQGTLHMLFEFQSQVATLLGADVANASMYDGATAAAEAVVMARRVTGRGRALLSGNLHPHYRDTITTLARLTGFGADSAPLALDGGEDLRPHIANDTACVVVQTPDVLGHLHALPALAQTCQQAGALLIVVVTEIVSLGLLPAPGEQGADIVVAEGQGLGNGLNFGGPYVGLFACKEKYIRQMPGRLCGQTVDADGRRGFVLTLSTREQHIRREKATSNICTNSGLCALAFSIHLTLLGGAGLQKLAALNHALAVELAEALEKIPGVTLCNTGFFNEFTLRLPKPAARAVEQLAQEKGILAGVPLSRLYPGEKAVENHLLIAVTETTTPEDRAGLIAALKECCA